MVKESFESFVFLRGANCQHRYCVLEVSLGPASMRPELSAALANPLAKPPRFGEPGFDESPAAAWCWRYYTEFRRNKNLDISSVSLWLLTTLQPGRSHLCLDCLDWYCIAFLHRTSWNYNIDDVELSWFILIQFASFWQSCLISFWLAARIGSHGFSANSGWGPGLKVHRGNFALTSYNDKNVPRACQDCHEWY